MSTTYKKSANETKHANNSEHRRFVLIDASGIVVGRLAAYVASLLRGKNKTVFTTHCITGDFVIITNASKAIFTSDKYNTKKYHRHTGFPGGLKTLTPKQLCYKNQAYKILEDAIRGMLPHNTLGREMFRNLRVFNESNHGHDAQNPILIDFATLNRKNSVK
ncbi:50S ribosomal protein L13 [Candidatus Deianiraea vastatrix]|uniref:Large ribosomal subunit protein uL13 n=1 Tax=Candidatus Deianiraea vastatrix TaxID=2163644 RepID=A0A5B8XEA6_9RICK|nr:50S ribosomal protein L13 [Candidatus Deianiraea vastatrix]QED23306.1 50S ribosomal protein L13 [Candidatus Deianiraea vastatrix]